MFANALGGHLSTGAGCPAAARTAIAAGAPLLFLQRIKQHDLEPHLTSHLEAHLSPRGDDGLRDGVTAAHRFRWLPAVMARLEEQDVFPALTARIGPAAGTAGDDATRWSPIRHAGGRTATGDADPVFATLVSRDHHVELLPWWEAAFGDGNRIPASPVTAAARYLRARRPAVICIFGAAPWGRSRRSHLAWWSQLASMEGSSHQAAYVSEDGGPPRLLCAREALADLRAIYDPSPLARRAGAARRRRATPLLELDG